MNKFTLPVIVEKDEDGYYASCPSLQGCYTQADTYEEILENIKDAISLHIEDRFQSCLIVNGHCDRLLIRDDGYRRSR
ncbi:MAG: type II toxin-antitoxin system HicB family antitoxin [Pseudanabaena sp.]|jgi:predicted RNase H-like HicB family nuclease